MNNLNSQTTSSQSPDQFLEELVRDSFEQLGYPQLTAVKCTADGDKMLLTGALSSFYLKQVAQSVAVKIPGVREVQNEIKVS